MIIQLLRHSCYNIIRLHVHCSPSALCPHKPADADGRNRSPHGERGGVQHVSEAAFRDQRFRQSRSFKSRARGDDGAVASLSRCVRLDRNRSL